MAAALYLNAGWKSWHCWVAAAGSFAGMMVWEAVLGRLYGAAHAAGRLEFVKQQSSSSETFGPG